LKHELQALKLPQMVSVLNLLFNFFQEFCISINFNNSISFTIQKPEKLYQRGMAEPTGQKSGCYANVN